MSSLFTTITCQNTAMLHHCSFPNLHLVALSVMPFPCHIILLLDLDCFCAQCKQVWLGLDLNMLLALLQWNSVLALTYLACELYGIKIGDSWDAM
jgi:hypothetical protein